MSEVLTRLQEDNKSLTEATEKMEANIHKIREHLKGLEQSLNINRGALEYNSMLIAQEKERLSAPADGVSDAGRAKADAIAEKMLAEPELVAVDPDFEPRKGKRK